MQHQEDYASDAGKDEQYFESYVDLSVHKVMLKDRSRMDFYRSILTDKQIVEGKLVVDVGSGSGILACWAAQSGATHVLSIEASSMSELQQQVFQDNHVAGKVTVISSTVEDLIRDGVDAFLENHTIVRQARGVHLVVSEWMGFYLFHECMLPSVLRARDFFNEVNAAVNADGGVQMIPSHGKLRAAPISLKPYYEEYFASFWNKVDGVCLETLGKLEFEEHLEAASPLVEVLPPRCLLHEGEVFWDGCFDTVHLDELKEVKATRVFYFSNSACARRRLQEVGDIVLDGVSIWFDVSFGRFVLDTALTAPPTHWKQTTMLLPREVREEELVSFYSVEEQLELTLCLTAQDLSHRSYKIEFELN